MSTPITVLGTGGTIASTSGEQGATPSKRGAELVESVPAIGEYASVSVEEVAQRPSFDMDFETAFALADRAEAAAETGAEGIVVTHGTDTMEESAYLLDVVLDVDVPIVFTGAQRRPDELSPDGPSNLLTAVRAAANPTLTESGGVYVAFNEELHAARDVTKVHTSKLETFASPERGPVAAFERDSVRFFRRPERSSLRIPVREVDATVEMVKTGLGVGPTQVARAVDAGVGGLVLEGSGLGNTTAALGDAVAAAVDDGVPVVVTSRCLAGSVDGVYGTPGGGATLHSRGVIPGGDLPAHKARLALALALSADADDATSDLDAVRGYFEAL